MDEINSPPAAKNATVQASNTLEKVEKPVVLVKFQGRWAGQVVNNRTGEVKKVLVQFREYKGRGPVDIRMVNPEMVEF